MICRFKRCCLVRTKTEDTRSKLNLCWLCGMATAIVLRDQRMIWIKKVLNTVILLHQMVTAYLSHVMAYSVNHACAMGWKTTVRLQLLTNHTTCCTRHSRKQALCLFMPSNLEYCLWTPVINSAWIYYDAFPTQHTRIVAYQHDDRACYIGLICHDALAMWCYCACLGGTMCHNGYADGSVLSVCLGWSGVLGLAEDEGYRALCVSACHDVFCRYAVFDRGCHVLARSPKTLAWWGKKNDPSRSPVSTLTYPKSQVLWFRHTASLLSMTLCRLLP